MEKGTQDLDHYIESIEYPIVDVEGRGQEAVKIVAKGVLQGLLQLKKLGILHRDLKPQNIVIKGDRKSVAICDFGSAIKCVEEGGQYPIEGFTRWYKCPEMLFGSRSYKYEIDVWSLGCILFELAAGEQLFPGKTELEQLALISNILGDPSEQNWPSIVKLHDFGKIQFVKKAPKTVKEISDRYGLSEGLVSFILRMVKYDSRASVEELLNDKYLENVENIQQSFQFKKGIFSSAFKKLEPKHFK